MAESPEKLSRFWQELKRRKVVRVITVYAAAAFVILELTSIIVEPLGLPEWTLIFLIVLLIVGFIIAVLLSWIYDVNPEKGIHKTAAADTAAVGKEGVSDTSITWKIASMVSFVIILGLILLNIFSPRSRKDALVEQGRSIAVLSFEDMSAQQDQEYFCDGMAEGIINSLMQLEHLKVHSRTSSFAFKNQQQDIREIGRLLNVDLILEGSVQKSGDRLRITAQLINAADGSHLWSEQYDRDMEDVFAIQDEISSAIVDKLRLGAQSDLGEASSRHTSDLAAYNLYLKGRFYWHLRTEKDMLISKDLFEQALQLDPGYALAYAGLADVYFIMTWWGHLPNKEGFEQAKIYTSKALDLNDRLSEAHATLGGILTWYDHDWEGAERELLQAISLNPNDANALQYYSELLNQLQRREEAWTYLHRAMELNPHSQMLYNLSASYYYVEGQYAKAIEECQKALDLATFSWPQRIMFSCNLMLGRDQQAIENIMHIISSDPNIEGRAMLDRIYAESGMEGILHWYIHRIQNIESEDGDLRTPSYLTIAKLYANLANPGMAMEYLMRAHEEEEVAIPWIRLYPDFKMLHDSARFQKIISELGF